MNPLLGIMLVWLAWLAVVACLLAVQAVAYRRWGSLPTVVVYEKLRRIQEDTWARGASPTRSNIIGVVVVVVVGLALFPVVQDFVAEALLNATGAVAILLPLIPLFYILGIALAVITLMRI